MRLRRMKFCFILFYILFALSFSKKIKGKMKFPFLKFTYSHKDFYSSILNLSCKDKLSNIKECAEQCYYGEKNGVKCVAFVKFKNTEECKICKPATITEVMNSDNTQIIDNHVDLVYVLKYKKKIPVMYLPLEGDNITGTTVTGDGVTGTLLNHANTQRQAGKVNQGLHVKNGARLLLDNTANTCIGNLALCTHGLSIALWINPSMHGRFEHITHTFYSISIVLKISGVIGVWTSGQPNSLSGLNTQSTISVGTWTHVAVVFDPDVGMSVYMNGILDAFKSIDEAFPITINNDPNDYMFGSKGGAFASDGILDEIKVFYASLTTADIWREYTSYKISLKEEEIWDIMVKRLHKDEIVVVHTDSITIKDEITLIRVEDGGCGKKGNSTGWFVHDYKVTNGCKIYQGYSSALWSGNQTLTSDGCSWWYIP